MNQDFRDVLAALLRAAARFLVVGAHAMAAHGVPRATGDLDVWVDSAPDNAERVWQALLEFGAPVDALPLSRQDLETPGQVIQMGVPPQRIDILTGVTGVEFESAWTGRIVHRVDTLDVPFIGREALLRNKRATGRAKDLADVEIPRSTNGRRLVRTNGRHRRPPPHRLGISRGKRNTGTASTRLPRPSRSLYPNRDARRLRRFTMESKIVLEPDVEDGGYVVHCPALAGCASQGETKEEATENIREAIEVLSRES